MIQKLKDFYNAACELGLKLPFIYDPVTKLPSVTLLFAYITFLMTVISVIALHIRIDLVIATITTMTFWIVAVVFYLIRNLQRAKLDLDDHSVELEGEKEDDKKDT